MLKALRDQVLERDGRCLWPGCDYEITFSNPLQLAHLKHRGMGGSRSRNTPDNCIALCAIHHDCLDGRTGLGTLRTELNTMLQAQI